MWEQKPSFTPNLWPFAKFHGNHLRCIQISQINVCRSAVVSALLGRHYATFEFLFIFHRLDLFKFHWFFWEFPNFFFQYIWCSEVFNTRTVFFSPRISLFKNDICRFETKINDSHLKNGDQWRLNRSVRAFMLNWHTLSWTKCSAFLFLNRLNDSHCIVSPGRDTAALNYTLNRICMPYFKAVDWSKRTHLTIISFISQWLQL